MSEWLSRDSEVTEDQKKVGQTAGRKSPEGRWCGVWQREPGFPPMVPSPTRGNGPVPCSCKMQLPQETGGTQTLVEVVIMAFTFAKLCSYWYTGGKVAWFGSTADMHSMPEMINPQPSSFHSSSFSSACLHSVIVWDIFSWLFSSLLEIKHRPCCWVPEFMTRTSFFQPQFPLRTSSQELHSDHLFCLLAPAILWMRNTAKGKQSEN